MGYVYEVLVLQPITSLDPLVEVELQSFFTVYTVCSNWSESRLDGLNRGMKLGVQIRQLRVDLKVGLGAVDLISLRKSNTGLQVVQSVD